MTDKPWICECGRAFGKRAGLSVHGRTCPVERRRSDLFCEAIEQGVPPQRVINHWRWIGRPLESPQAVTYQESILDGANPDEGFYE